MSNVKLAIRVRPFTEREQRSEKERLPIVNIIDENAVTITNVKVSVSGAGDSRPRVRRYSVDYAFDSACSPSLTTYASQEKIYDTIGRDVVERVSRGCSACVLAYGQSATGKTYTMIGTDTEPGLVPRICRALGEVDSTEITVSFLEIYNERVHDLLAGESAPPTCHSLPRRRGNARKDLRVREHPDRGTYVQNLRRVAIHSVEDLLSLVREGGRRRCTAATRRNSTSSRSHALLELATPTATLHLADLAGSEKAGWEGCGGRQKEGANINKSLVALSNVISALVRRGNGRSRFVPYRDSALTWLLKDCFTGGASTFIIATVSPSVACYGESASTLRWAACARQLPNSCASTARTATTRAAILAHYNQLLAELSRNYIRYVPDIGKIFYDDDHWKIYDKNINSQLSGSKIANIGNIMNMLQPKADTQSESTTSSAASGSSDVINTMDKNIKIDISTEISKEVDKLFVPTLERTQSNTDLKVIAPLRHKRRQYKSQEILPIEEDLNTSRLNLTNVLPSHSEAQFHNANIIDKSKITQIPILYDNQRAEIVASVTERLYNKIKKKEEAAASKMESVIDKKIIEPLNELKICTNARQRLVELSQKALRNKRRIGIPAHTQTRKIVTRVRDKCIDVQTDLEAYFLKNKENYALRRDAATETIPMTPRSKEIAVGSEFGMLNFRDRSTLTEDKKIIHKSSLVMTDSLRKYDRSTQTQVMPPPRRKKRNNCCKCMKRTDDGSFYADERTASIISINISQSYPIDSESQSSDEYSDNQVDNDKPSSVNMTPDLLTNHNTVDTKPDAVAENGDLIKMSKNDTVEKNDLNENTNQNQNQSDLQNNVNDDFSDSDDCSLPRVTVDCSRKVEPDEMKDIILGRNDNMYPYNIVLSPPRERDQTKILVTFSNDDNLLKEEKTKKHCRDYSTSRDSNIIPKSINKSIEVGDCQNLRSRTCSNSSELSKADSFIWKKGCVDNKVEFKKTSNHVEGNFTPVYKSKSLKYAKAKAKLYREFMGLDKEDMDDNDSTVPIRSSKKASSSDSSESQDMSYNLFKQKRNYLENNLTFKPYQGHGHTFKSLEQGLLDSCNSLEMSVNKYDNYVASYQNGNKNSRRESLIRTPTEYLQHLVQLRREVVKGDYDTDSSFGYLPE